MHLYKWNIVYDLNGISMDKSAYIAIIRQSGRENDSSWHWGWSFTNGSQFITWYHTPWNNKESWKESNQKEMSAKTTVHQFSLVECSIPPLNKNIQKLSGQINVKWYGHISIPPSISIPCV